MRRVVAQTHRADPPFRRDERAYRYRRASGARIRDCRRLRDRGQSRRSARHTAHRENRHGDHPGAGVRIVPAEPVAAPAPRTVEASPAKISSTQLLAAIELHLRQALVRAEAPGADREEAFIAAAENLRAESTKFTAAGRGSVDSRQLEELSARVRSQEAAAANLVRLADAQRELVSQYWQHFEAMDAQMKASVDRAWKIFGRVIARESLIQLSRDLDALRPNLTNGSAKGDTGGPDMAALAVSLPAFAASLDNNRSSLVRSQGADWVERMGKATRPWSTFTAGCWRRTTSSAMRTM